MPTKQKFQVPKIHNKGYFWFRWPSERLNPEGFIWSQQDKEYCGQLMIPFDDQVQILRNCSHCSGGFLPLIPAHNVSLVLVNRPLAECSTKDRGKNL